LHYSTLCILSAIFILFVDILTGEHIHFPIFFAFPAALAAWQLNRTLAYTLSLTLPLLRVGFFYIWNNGQFDVTAIVNTLITMVALSTYVYLITRIMMEKEE
jgi:hypothetical protein